MECSTSRRVILRLDRGIHLFLTSSLTALSLKAFLLYFFVSIANAQEVFVSATGFLDDPLKFEILDVRKRANYERGHVHGAKWVNVNSLDDPDSLHGSMLRDLSELERGLRTQGVNGTNPILILGNSLSGWGEEGRLFWLLHRSHSGKVFILDGGYQALKNRAPISKAIPQNQLGIIRLKLQAPLFDFESLQKTHPSRLLDVRSFLEYGGTTPFGSSWGGHLPGARSFPWSRFFNPQGLLTRQNDRILREIEVKDPVLYCTAGYRSALIYAVLLHWGLSPRNYDGSWYEYSSRTTRSVSTPLSHEDF